MDRGLVLFQVGITISVFKNINLKLFLTNFFVVENVQKVKILNNFT